MEYLETENTAFRDQLTSIGTNFRQDSLILKSNEFGQRNADEGVEEKVIRTLNAMFDCLGLKSSDVQASHLLQTDNTVICNFMYCQCRGRSESESMTDSSRTRERRATDRSPVSVCTKP